MNIGLFSDSYLPTKSGVVTVVIQLREQLTKMGHTVVLVCPETTEEFKTDDPLTYRAKSKPLGLKTDQFVSLPSRKRLIAFIKEKNLDIIHCHTEYGIGRTAAYIAKKLHIPAVCTIHTMWVEFYKYYLKTAPLITPSFVDHVMERFYNHFDTLIAVSSKGKNYYKNRKLIPNVPIVVIPNAIDTDKFKSSCSTDEEKRALREKHGIKEDDVLFLFLGRIAEEKRVFELAEQCKKLVELNPKAKVIFVGDGPAYQDLLKATEKQRQERTIMFTGFIEWTETHKYYEIADAFITASLSEMHSMTILEAELCALPIVSRNDESFWDCVFPGKNGYLADTDEKFLENMLEIAESKEKRKTFGKASLEITKNFTIESYVKKTILLYEEIIKAYPEKIDESSTENKIKLLQESLLSK